MTRAEHTVQFEVMDIADEQTGDQRQNPLKIEYSRLFITAGKSDNERRQVIEC